MFLLRVEEIGSINNNLFRYYYTVSLESVQSANGKSPEFSTLYEVNVENSIIRPIDGLAPNDYNIIEIIIIQIILSGRRMAWTSSAEHPNWQRWMQN